MVAIKDVCGAVTAVLVSVCFLAGAAVGQCAGPCAGDVDGDGQVTIEEIVQGVGNALTGCPCRVVVGFDGLATSVRRCGQWDIGEELSSQFARLGGVFAVNQFGIAYGATMAQSGGTPNSAGASGDPLVVVNTIDETTRCFSNTRPESGVLTARFVDPGSGSTRSVSGVRVRVSDSSKTVGVRAIDGEGQTVHDCPNAFVGCPLVTNTLSDGRVVDLRFTGEIVTVQFIDEGQDGFTVDDLSYVRPVPACEDTP